MNKIFSTPIIEAISCVLPKNKLVLRDLGELYGIDTVKKICRATGISELRIASKDMTSADYCLKAAENLFATVGVSPDDIEGLVFVTTTPDYIIPHTSAIMQDKLGIPTSALTFDINYGCAGYVYGLFQSFLLVESGYCKKVLLCVGDTESKYINEKDRSLRMVIGDAGTATLIEANNNSTPSAFTFFTDGSGARHIIVPAGGCRVPKTIGVTDQMHYDEDGNGRTAENLYMNGMEVMTFALHDVCGVLIDALKLLSLRKDDIDLFAFHQANAFIVHNLAQQLKVEKSKVPFGAELTGNTSCSSIPSMLATLYSGINVAFRQVAVCGFGTGLSCAAGIVDLSKTVVLPIKYI